MNVSLSTLLNDPGLDLCYMLLSVSVLFYTTTTYCWKFPYQHDDDISVHLLLVVSLCSWSFVLTVQQGHVHHKQVLSDCPLDHAWDLHSFLVSLHFRLALPSSHCMCVLSLSLSLALSLSLSLTHTCQPAVPGCPSSLMPSDCPCLHHSVPTVSVLADSRPALTSYHFLASVCSARAGLLAVRCADTYLLASLVCELVFLPKGSTWLHV